MPPGVRTDPSRALVCRCPMHLRESAWNHITPDGFLRSTTLGASLMRSVFLWLIGIPIPIILLLALCTHHF